MVLAVRERGAGRPIVLLPWFGLDGGVTELAFEPAFAEPTGWRRIYIDLPGTGRSAAVAPNSDAVLDAVRDTVASLPRYLLAGCSYGGYLAAGLARRDPERVEGLLLVCAGVKIRPADRNLTRVVPSSPQPHWLDDVPEPLREHFAHGVGRQSRSGHPRRRPAGPNRRLPRYLRRPRPVPQRELSRAGRRRPLPAVRAAGDVRRPRPRLAHEVNEIQACRLSEAASLTIRPEPDSVHRSSPITSARVTPARKGSTAEVGWVIVPLTAMPESETCSTSAPGLC